jgi:hypothetical protein
MAPQPGRFRPAHGRSGARGTLKQCPPACYVSSAARSLSSCRTGHGDQLRTVRRARHRDRAGAIRPELSAARATGTKLAPSAWSYPPRAPPGPSWRHPPGAIRRARHRTELALSAWSCPPRAQHAGPSWRHPPHPNWSCLPREPPGRAGAVRRASPGRAGTVRRARHSDRAGRGDDGCRHEAHPEPSWSAIRRAQHRGRAGTVRHAHSSGSSWAPSAARSSGAELTPSAAPELELSVARSSGTDGAIRRARSTGPSWSCPPRAAPGRAGRLGRA